MRMTEETIKKFPKLHYYVRVDMPKVATVNAIISEIQKQAGISPPGVKAKKTITEKQIKDALAWGKGPVVTVVPNLVCAGVKAYGCFSSGKDELRIDEKMVKEFEAGKGKVKTKSGKLVYLVGATLLHELTHWADDFDKIDNPVEEGNAYEKAVYGKVLG